MKLELDISEDLWKRIEHRASLFNLPADAFVLRLLEQHTPHISDPAAAIAWMKEVIADGSGEEDDNDLKELAEALERNRGSRDARPITEQVGAVR